MAEVQIVGFGVIDRFRRRYSSDIPAWRRPVSRFELPAKVGTLLNFSDAAVGPRRGQELL